MLKKLLVLFLISLMVSGTAVAQADEENKEIPSQLTSEHWAHKEVAALLEKFGAEKKLPEEKPYPKDVLIDRFVAALVKVAEKYDKEGSRAVTRDDLDSIRSLIVALEAELFKIDA
ncbi:MAG TPA: hypothetical protein VJZ49_03970, partial [Syntrophales bacterium]|nr:hypothetical protein [Syntrophales bacterium]